MILDNTELAQLKATMTDKEIAFAQYYVIDSNAAKACRSAGYLNSNSPRHSFAAKGWELKQRPHIRRYTKHLVESRAEELAITHQMILMELAKIAFSSAEDYMNFDGDTMTLKSASEMSDSALRAIKKIKVTEKAMGNDIIEIDTHDKLKALGMLRESLGFMQSTTIDITPVETETKQLSEGVTIRINHRKKGEYIDD